MILSNLDSETSQKNSVSDNARENRIFAINKACSIIGQIKTGESLVDLAKSIYGYIQNIDNTQLASDYNKNPCVGINLNDYSKNVHKCFYEVNYTTSEVFDSVNISNDYTKVKIYASGNTPEEMYGSLMCKLINTFKGEIPSGKVIGTIEWKQ
jgi:hypothetical protein